MNKETKKPHKLFNDDCLTVLKKMPNNKVDSIVTDPPAGISFMGKDWDNDKGGRDSWVAWMTEVFQEVMRVLKPGGHGLVWALPRTSHWTATALEDAGFEIRDVVTHLFGSGFPKSHNIINKLKKELKCQKVEKHTVNNAVASIFQESTTTETDGQGSAPNPVLVRINAEGKIKPVKIVESLSIWQKHIVSERVEETKELSVLMSVSPIGNNKGLVKIIPTGKVGSSSDQMVTLLLTLEMGNIDWNILSSLNNTSEDQLSVMKMFITSMELETTIALKIYNFFLNRNTQSYITNNHSALKPSTEEWILIRKPLSEKNIADNVIVNGVGGLNIDACRVGTSDNLNGGAYSPGERPTHHCVPKNRVKEKFVNPTGRFPANLILSHHEDCYCVGYSEEVTLNHNAPKGTFAGGEPDRGSDTEEYRKNKSILAKYHCVEGCPIKELDEQSGASVSTKPIKKQQYKGGCFGGGLHCDGNNYGDKGGASRFFYCPKPSKKERNAGLDGFEEKRYSHDGRDKEIENPYQRNKSVASNNHPTVKSLKLCDYLIKLITPPNGIVLDCFMGSGSIGCAAVKGGWKFIGIEKDEEYFEIAKARVEYWYNKYLEGK